MVMPLLAVGIVALFAMAGLALDAGQVYVARTQIQHAADAAALAAAQEFQKSGGANVEAVARSTATANGFTDGINNITVMVSPNPSGYPVNSGYVQVTIAQTLPTSLSAVIGIQALVPSGSAVGGPSPYTMPCLLLRPNPINQIAVDLGGSSSLVGAGCSFIVRSTHAKAISTTNNNGVSASSVVLATGGGWQGSVTPTPSFATQDGNVFNDPFASMPAPALSTCKTPLPTVNFQPDTPGGTVTYCSDVNINASATFQPGIYIFTRALKLSGSASLTGAGVLFYFQGPNSSINMVGTGALSLSAATSGTYKGILIWQDKVNTTKVQLKGGSSMDLSGNLYFPSAAVELSGGSSSSTIGLVVASKVSTSGGSSINLRNTFPTNFTTSGSGAILFE